jgi:quercetin dioxygenase-like cupin family protein
MERIEIRACEVSSWQAVSEQELDGHASLSRELLAPGGTFPGTEAMSHVWVAEGTLSVEEGAAPQRLSPGDLAVPAAVARLRAGPEGAVVWVVHCPLAPPERTEIIRGAEGDAVILAGDRYTVKRHAGETAGHLGLLHFAIPPGGGPIPHIHHREEEIFVVLRGHLSLYADGLRTHASPGQVICLPRGLPHGFHNLTSEPAEMLCLLAPGGGERFFVEAGRPAQDGEVPAPDPAELRRILAVATRHGVEMRPDIPDPYLPWPGEAR